MMINDLFISAQKIEQELNDITRTGTEFASKLLVLDQKVKYIFSKIKTCKTMKEADKYFELLDHIQGSLVTLISEQDIGIPGRLWKFTTDFDNFEEAKVYYFDKIKTGEYTF